MQIVRHVLNALALENRTGYTGRDLLFAICQVNTPLYRPLRRVVRHQLRLFHNQPLHRLLIPQGKISAPRYLLNGIGGIVAVQTVNPRRSVVDVAHSRFIGLGISLGHLVSEVFKTLPTAYLSHPPLLVVGLLPFLSILDSANEVLHLFIPRHRHIQKKCAVPAWQALYRSGGGLRQASGSSSPSVTPSSSASCSTILLSSSSAALRFSSSSTSSGVSQGRWFNTASSSR